MSDDATLIRSLYAAFNARDIDRVLSAMTADVDWPNGWEGGRLVGQAAVRSYWTRQWAEIDPTVTPQEIRRESDGRLAVAVHQLVKDKAGAIVAEGPVEHVYRLRDGQVASMEIR